MAEVWSSVAPGIKYTSLITAGFSAPAFNTAGIARVHLFLSRSQEVIGGDQDKVK